MKKMFSIILALCLLLSILPMPAMASNQSDTVSNTIVNYISSNHKSFKSSYGGKAWGCFAFCNYVWKGVFGKDYYANTHGGASSGTNTSDIYGFLIKNNAKAGDILWCGTSDFSITHNMIILAYDSEGLWLSDGTETGTLWHNNARINYNDKTYVRYFGGNCRLALYKVNDTYWNAVANGSTSAPSSPIGTPATPPAPSAMPQTPSAIVESGEWDVYIPANYKLLLYGSETAANSITYVSARASSYRVVCSKKATLSNGIVRYYGAFNANDHYWLTYTNGMTIENADAAKVHTVNFNANGGSVSTSHKQVTAGGIYGDLPTPTRSDYTFDGWYTAAMGGTQVISSTTVNLPNNQVTLYAHWTQNVPNLSIRSTEQGNWRITLSDEGAALYETATSTSSSGRYNYKTIDCYQKALLSDGSIRYCAKLSFSEGEKSRWVVFANNMSVEDRSDPHVPNLSIRSTEQGNWRITLSDEGAALYETATSTSSSGRYNYKTIDCYQKALLSDGSIRYCAKLSFSEGEKSRWVVFANNMSVEDRRDPPAHVVKYVNCYSQIACASGTVNLYKKPGDTTRYDFFSNGQSTGSSTYALMSDGSKWYQAYVSSNGTSMDLWLRGDNSISVTTRHTYGGIQYEKAHPHKGYQVCECGQKAYTGTNGKVDSCADCDKVRVTLNLGTIGPKVPAESITVTNGYRYLYVYKPTGEVIKQIGGDVYEVHMIPGSTYQLNIVVTPSNTTDRIQYSIRLPSNNPSNGGGVSVSNTGLISANDTAHGSVIVEITCGNCKTEVYIIMCTSTGERL